MAVKQTTDNILTAEFRVSFPDVFKPNLYGGKETYQLTMLIPKEDKEGLDKLKALAGKVAKAAWPDASQRPQLVTPFQDGDQKEYDGYKGHMAVRAGSKYAPGIVNANREDIIQQSEFYAGCYARAQINAYAWEFGGKAGVSFGLQNVQKLRDGDPFGSRATATSAFDDGYVPPAGFDDAGSNDIFNEAPAGAEYNGEDNPF